MKINYIYLAVIGLLAYACTSDGVVRDLGVSAVGKLYEPANDKTVKLESSASAALYFEWQPAVRKMEEMHCMKSHSTKRMEISPIRCCLLLRIITAAQLTHPLRTNK